MIHDLAPIPLSEPTFQAHYRAQLARESRVVKAKKLPQQPTVDIALLRASWMLAASRFVRPA